MTNEIVSSNSRVPVHLTGDLPPAATDGFSDCINRKGIRKSRKKAAKQAKRALQRRYEEVLSARPPNSRPADQILRAAVDLYRDGQILRRNLKAAVAELEANIRRELPDLAIIRAPRTVSMKPHRVGMMIFEPRAITMQDDKIVTAENHTVILEERQIIFITGLLPGGTRPHLFERVMERGSRKMTMSEILLQLSDVWPTLLWMRSEQRRQGRGWPINVMLTPFADGLLFGSLEQIEGLPPAGPNVAIVTTNGTEKRQIRDFYGDTHGNRLWAMTKTYVDAALLASDQLQLRDMLRSFVSTYHDVVADNNWRWRIGLGAVDPAVDLVATTFGLTTPSDERRISALSALEAIVDSAPWRSVAADTLASQTRHVT